MHGLHETGTCNESRRAQYHIRVGGVELALVEGEWW